MFALRLTLRPTGGLTFRRVPFSTLEMLSYPFIPPTALSGYLDRVVRLARGIPLPEMEGSEDTEFHVLPQSYHVLGALPQPAATIVTTTRQGIRSFDHTAFSRIQRLKDGKNYQLYRWEYIFAETFLGFVLHEEEQALEALLDIQNYGCKIGKEGWAYVEQVEGPFALEVQRASAVPSSLLPALDAFGEATHLYPLYRYAWKASTLPNQEIAENPAEIEGFLPFLAATTTAPIETDYYQTSGISIPVTLLHYF